MRLRRISGLIFNESGAEILDVKNLFEYDNYREYLADYYANTKAKDPSFSYRKFAKWAGYKSPNFLLLLIKGKANLTPEGADAVAEAMELGGAQKKYFCLLVRLNQATLEVDRRQAISEILQIKGFAKFNPLSKAKCDYLSKWYYPAIKELVALPSFVESPDWINQAMGTKLPASEIKQVIEDLLKMGMLHRHEGRKLKVSDDAVLVTDDIQSTLLVEYHQGFIELAKRSLDRYDHEKREVHGLTFPISEQSLDKFKELVLKFRDEAMALTGDSEEFDSVYQLNVQLFPLARTKP